MPITNLIALAVLGQAPTHVSLTAEAIMQPIGGAIEMATVSQGKKLKAQIKNKVTTSTHKSTIKVKLKAPLKNHKV